MATPRFLDEIGAKLSEIAANSPVRDFEKNAKAMVSRGRSMEGSMDGPSLRNREAG